MIQVTRLKVHNYALIKDAEIRFEPSEFVYLTGQVMDADLGEVSIGSGKSTTLSALWFALSGDVVQRITLPEVIGEADTYLATEVELKDEQHKYKIERRRTAKAGSVTFSIDGQVQQTKNAGDTERLIEEVFGVSWPVFRFTNFIPQEDTKTGFLYATDAERKQLISKLYHKDFFDKMLSIIQDDIRETKIKIAETAEELAKLEGAVESSEATLKSLDKQIAEAKAQNAKVSGDIDIDYEQMAGQLDIEIADQEEKVGRLEALVERSRRLHQVLNNKHVAALKTADAHDKEISKLKQKCDLELEQLAEVKKTLKFAEACPTCGQPFTREAVAQLKKACNEHIRRYRGFEAAIASEETYAQKDRQAALQAEAWVAWRGRKTLALGHALRRWRGALGESRGRRKKIAEILSKYIDIAPLQRSRADVVGRLKTLHADLFDVQGRSEELAAILKHYRVLESGYSSTIRSMAFESVIDRFTQAVSGQLVRLFGTQLAIRFDTTVEKGGTVKDKFAVMVKRKDHKTWRSAVICSGGQKRIVTLAIALAMLELSKPGLGLFMADEALENLSGAAFQTPLGVLRELSRSMMVLFVTHSSKADVAQERTVTAIYRDGVVHIEN